jgi:ABC-2 type transport system permease protein
MWAVYKREMQAFFLSPLGYVFMGFFLLISGYFFTVNNIFTMNANFNTVLGNIIFLFMMLVPVLTMRLLSEEKKTKTDQLLLTSPVPLLSIVMGKYMAAVSVFLLTLLVTSIYPIILFIYGSPALAEILGGYLGFFLMGCTFIAIGLFVSSLTENQLTAYIATFAVLLLMWLIDWITPNLNNMTIVRILEWLSVLKRFNNFGMGILGLSPVVYYISFSAVFVFLAMRVIEKRRWSKG